MSAVERKTARREDGEDIFLDLMRPKPTGRTLVTFDAAVPIDERAGIVGKVADGEFGTLGLPGRIEMEAEPAARTSSARLAAFGLAVVPEQKGTSPSSLMRSLSALDGVTAVRPEFYLFALEAPIDTQQATWGVHATRAFDSPYTGKGVKVAILDTGLDFGHPEFKSRAIVRESFVAGETPDDVQGHGTHCAGTAAGWSSTSPYLRYGIAPDAELHIAKVLNNHGAGREADIIAAMLWAIDQGCAVISMSLGRAVRPGEEATPQYEEVARLALASGSLIVAAAGNDSTRRYGFVAPVSEPANAPSIMAVAALNADLSVAGFSNGSANPRGGEVDIAAPGVGIISTVPGPKTFDRFAGTSMACPHVAGVAALWAEADPTLRGEALWDALVGTALPLGESHRDVGAGLVQAPVDIPVPVS